jgi:hypothetical protein
MTAADLPHMTVAELVERFVAIALEQDRAELDGNMAKVKRLYRDMEAVEAALKGRQGDQRRALLPLLTHPHVQVRLKAAKSSLGVAPVEAREALEKVAGSHISPQNGEAGMSLWALDEGIFKPE